MDDKALKALKEGGIVIYPTDTVFGIGCRIDNPEAVDRLFKIRRRPPKQAMPVLVASPEQALTYFDNPSYIVRRLMEKYWPGALTIVAACKKDLIYSPIRGSGETVGLRMPNHEVPIALIKGVGVPILGPSANFHGDPTPYFFKNLNKDLIALVDYVIPGECALKTASTVVDCSVSPLKIIRQDAVRLAKLFLDTSDSQEIKVAIEIDGKIQEKVAPADKKKAQVVLSMIERILQENKASLGDLIEIEVKTGPGSFTGLRVGFAVANTLGMLLNIPVNQKSPFKPNIPSY